MKMYAVYVGCNVAGKPVYKPEYVRCVCEELLELLGFDGATFTEAVGVWKGVEEKTVVCDVCTDKPRAAIERFATLIKQTLEQESVMVIESAPRIDFV